ncbi:MAG: ATP-binding protein [Ignavibacteriales bacterium]|nr:ATP-binding protein [Ignavibacteriales bacterium]
MVKPIKKIGLFLILIIGLPIIFFAFREIISLNANEKIIGDIYKNQLESILFSVNQYSEDIVRSWTTKIQAAVDQSDGSKLKMSNRLKRFFDDNSPVVYIFLSDSTLIKNGLLNRSSFKENDTTVQAILKQNLQIISRLYRYRASNFFKIEPLQKGSDDETQLLIFILSDGRLCGLAINKLNFVTQNLASKIQSAARSEFTFVVFDSVKNRNIYSIDYSSDQKIQRSNNLWLIPNYSLGIALKGTTIESLARNRTYTNLVMIVALSVLMLIVAWFGYRNIKHEVELAQIKSDFVSNVSHELRTPLALINMFAETLSMGRITTEEKRNEYYGIIQQETERLSRIVNKILTFSKIEAGKWQFNFSKTDLNLIAGKIYDNYKFHLQQKGFEFLFEPAGSSIEINLDPEALSESVINLLDNAIKYSNNNKRVILRTGLVGAKAFIEVEDSGVGISNEEQKKIFDKFYRAGNVDLHNTKGTGLGLTLVKHMVDAHKGEIKLKSEIGKGSSFRLIFPIDQTK